MTNVPASTQNPVSVLLAVLFVLALQGLVLWGAWNTIAVPLFAVPALTFTQACGAGVLLDLAALPVGAFAGLCAAGSKKDA